MELVIVEVVVVVLVAVVEKLLVVIELQKDLEMRNLKIGFDFSSI